MDVEDGTFSFVGNEPGAPSGTVCMTLAAWGWKSLVLLVTGCMNIVSRVGCSHFLARHLLHVLSRFRVGKSV